MSDDWCYVESETGSVRSPSFDLVEPELELEPMYVEEVVAAPKTATATLHQDQDDDANEVDVSALLSERSATPTTCYSRSLRLSLLSPAHHRYVVTGATASPKMLAPRKRSVREAFTAPSRREHTESSVVARVRAAMPSRRQAVGSTGVIEATPVTSLTKDMAVQTDTLEEPVQSGRLSALSSALDRSLRLSMELKAKAHTVERLDVRGMLLQGEATDLRLENEQLKKQLKTAERGLRISRKRSELAEEYQDHLKRGLEQLRSETDLLHQRIEVLAGGLDVDAKSVAELEQLEDALDKAMTMIRGALRAKYRASIRGGSLSSVAVSQGMRKPSEDGCVVCMEKVPCVRLEPCGHEVLCSACAVRVSECPIDRQQITDKVLTYGLTAYEDSE